VSSPVLLRIAEADLALLAGPPLAICKKIVSTIVQRGRKPKRIQQSKAIKSETQHPIEIKRNASLVPCEKIEIIQEYAGAGRTYVFFHFHPVAPCKQMPRD
jgi:hypothetical protein